MLNFVEPRVALHYFLLVLVGFVGVLQIIAAHYRRSNLSLVPPERGPWVGTALGSLLILGAFAWFVVATPEMLRPGPAGAELVLLFGAAALLAVLICRLAAALRQK